MNASTSYYQEKKEKRKYINNSKEYLKRAKFSHIKITTENNERINKPFTNLLLSKQSKHENDMQKKHPIISIVNLDILLHFIRISLPRIRQNFIKHSQIFITFSLIL